MRDRRTPLRLMAWNLCQGGRGTPAGDSLDLIAEQIAAVDADVVFCTETAGATERIVDACRAAGRADCRGHRLSADDADDNLAIVTHLPVVARMPYPAGRTVDSYNVGGLRLRLPGGRDIAVFDTWLRFDVEIVEALEGAAAEVATGRRRTRTDEDLALLELPQLANVEEILSEYLPAMVPDSATPVIIAGGLNTESHLDSVRADLPYRPQWQVTRRLAKAGFLDTFRAAHPDPEAVPGGTYDALDPDQRLPHRIDYVLAGGAGIEVVDARVLDGRLPEHGPGPFYSDHAALVVDLLIAE
ncbi:MAG: endonuclease/exonuclease/phosphatase family protein [Actinocatenispora sp.]